MTLLNGRTVMVVGAGAVGEGWGNGNASAVSYAREGANVVCVDSALERASTTAALVCAEGGTAMALEADATDEATLRAAVEETLGTYGRLDVMHNNVGSGVAAGAPDTCPPEDWDRQLAVSLTSAYLGTRVASPVMREQGGGVITNTSSTLSVRFLRRPVVAYSAAKAGLEAMTRACALAYGPHNIRVNAIRVGFAETAVMKSRMTELDADQYEAAMAKSRSRVPLRNEHTDPFSIAAAAVFLASDRARDLTGVILNVDGGLEAAPL